MSSFGISGRKGCDSKWNNFPNSGDGVQLSPHLQWVVLKVRLLDGSYEYIAGRRRCQGSRIASLRRKGATVERTPGVFSEATAKEEARLLMGESVAFLGK